MWATWRMWTGQWWSEGLVERQGGREEVVHRRGYSAELSVTPMPAAASSPPPTASAAPSAPAATAAPSAAATPPAPAAARGPGLVSLLFCICFQLLTIDGEKACIWHDRAAWVSHMPCKRGVSSLSHPQSALWRRTKPRFQMKGYTWPRQHVDGTTAHSLPPVIIKTCTGWPPAMVLRMLKSSKVPSGRTTWKHFDPFCAWGRI